MQDDAGDWGQRDANQPVTRAMVIELINEWNNVENKDENTLINHFKCLLTTRPIVDNWFAAYHGGNGWNVRKKLIENSKMFNLLTWYIDIVANSFN